MPLPKVPAQPLAVRIVHAVLLRVSPAFFWRGYLHLADMFLSLANLLLTRAHGGVHPKHAIMQYEQFFLRFIGMNDTVLDVGSGVGAVTLRLAEQARSVTGIEMVEDQVSLARARHGRPNITYVHTDLARFAPAERFDVCVMSNVLEHIDDRVGALRRVRELADTLLVRVPAIDRDWWPIFRRDAGLEWRSDTTHFIEHSEEELRAELAAAGWRIDLLERRWGEFYAKCVPLIVGVSA